MSKLSPVCPSGTRREIRFFDLREMKRCERTERLKVPVTHDWKED